MTIARQNEFLKDYFGEKSPAEPLSTKPWVVSDTANNNSATGQLKTFQSDNESGLHSSSQSQFLEMFLGNPRVSSAASDRSSTNSAAAVSVGRTDTPIKPEVNDCAPEVEEKTEIVQHQKHVAKSPPELDSGFIQESEISDEFVSQILGELEDVSTGLDSGFFVQNDPVEEIELEKSENQNSMMSQLLAESEIEEKEIQDRAPEIIRSHISVSPSEVAKATLKRHHAELSDISLTADKVRFLATFVLTRNN